MPGLSVRLPAELFWAVGGISVVAGLASILMPDRIVRCLRAWLIRQMRWVRGVRYRQYLRLQGWLLFVLGTLMLMLMAIMGSRDIWI